MLKKLIVPIVIVVLAIGAYVYWEYNKLGPGIETSDWEKTEALDPAIWKIASPGKTVTVMASSQGWTPEVRASFWHIDQGSLLTPYDIFLNLETHDGTGLFAGVENMTRLRYVSQSKSKSNPNALPLGFTKTENEWKGETYAGMNCLACHSTVISYKDNAMLIDGAPTQADYQRMIKELSASLTKAYKDDATFEAIANRMKITGDAAKSTLRTRLEAAALQMDERVELNATTSVYGNGRVDAVGQIYNSVTSANTNQPENRTEPDAPVSYPFIWGTGQSDVVQWTGFAPNEIPGGVLIRNVGEVLGVFGGIDVVSKEDKKWFELGFVSSINTTNLGTIEEWVNTMEPPAWPSDILPPIDVALAAAGKTIYEKNCASCHEVVTPFQVYKATLTQVSEIRTDGTAELKTLEKGINSSGDEESKVTMLAKQVGGVLLNHPKEAIKSVVVEAMPEKFGKTGTTTYKARPLNAIWATAPYLHNGSVPTLDDLLKPAKDRPVTFTLGGWEFDPVKVGYAPYSGDRVFTYDTSLPGNSNVGHDAGTTLDTADRKALIEYLKTL